MKKSRYSDSQILAIIKQAESGVPIHELCREHGMSGASFKVIQHRGAIISRKLVDGLFKSG